MSLPLTFLDLPQHLYATEEIDEVIQLAASDFHADQYTACVKKCLALINHFTDIPFYFLLSIYLLLGSAYQDFETVKKYHDLALFLYEKARTEHVHGQNPSLDSFLDSIRHMIDYVSDWKNGLEEREKRKRHELPAPNRDARLKSLRDSLYEPLQKLELDPTT